MLFLCFGTSGCMQMARRIIFFMAILVFVVIASASWMIGLSIKKHDEIAGEQSIDFVKKNIAQELDQIKQIAKDYSWWTDAYENLAVRFSEDWAHTNVGLYLYDLHGIDLSFVVGPDDRTLYGQIDGKRVNENALSLFSSPINQMIDRARATSDQGAPTPDVGLLAIGDQIALVGVSAIKPEVDITRPQPEGWATVLISAKTLSPEILADIEAQLPISQLEFVRGDRAGHLSLDDPTGSQLASLDWQASKPGSTFARSVWPWGLGILALISFFTIVVLLYVRRSTSRIEANEARFRDVADASSDWIWETDSKLRLTYLSMDLSEETGKMTKEWRGQPIGQLFQPIEISKQWRWVEDDARQLASFRNLLCTCTIEPDGAQRTLRLTGKPFYSARGQFEGYRGTATDTTRELAAQRNAEYLATHDSLTGLVNRDVLYERLGSAIAKIDEQSGPVAVICLDLDRFKDVNDTLGHAIGDLLLRQLADRLRQCTTKRDTIARISGDEFAIIQPQQGQPKSAIQLCTCLLAEISKPFHLDGQDIFTSASLGITLVLNDQATSGDVLQKADIALYEAKRHGGSTYRLYDSGLDRRRRERKSIETDLRRARDLGQLKLFYQPIIATASQKTVVGAEALIRWHHPKRGLIEPETFIDIAEDSGLILPLSEWVVWTACHQAAAWPHIKVAINISPLQFRHKDMVRMVRRALDDTNLAPDRLEIEITEGVLLKDTEITARFLRQLKELGIQLVIDDFGTGYSNLSYIKKFDFDKLKIDRSFLSGGQGSSNDLVRAIISLGHSLGMHVCAEGVEHSDQMEFLRRERCDQAQGFHIGRPCPADVFAHQYISHLVQASEFPRLERNKAAVLS